MNYLNKHNIILYLFITLFSLIVNIQVWAVGGLDDEEAGSSSVSTDSYNAMLIIDKSGSMNTTDRNHLSQDAAKMFIDSLNSTKGLKNSSVGVISFSKEAELLTTPVELNSQSQSNFVKSKIEAITYDPSGKGGTDIGQAIKLAAETLKNQGDTEKKNLVLLFTDGYEEGVGQASEELLEEGISLSKDMGCEIYIIGLNHKRQGNDSIKAQGREKIAKIAGDTQIRQGIYQAEDEDKKVNYLITDSLKEVYDFYMDVYAILRGAMTTEVLPYTIVDETGERKKIYEVPVTDQDIIEANIFMVSDQIIGEVQVYNQNGEKAVIDGQNIVMNRGEKYVVLKLFKPEPGIWKVQTPEEVDYHVSYLLNRGVELAVIAKKGEMEREAVIIVKAMYEGKEIGDSLFYDKLSETIFRISGPDIADKFEGELVYDQVVGSMIGYFNAPIYGDYQIEATIVGEGFQRTARTTIKFEAPVHEPMESSSASPEMNRETEDSTEILSDVILPAVKINRRNPIYAVLVVIVLFSIAGILAMAIYRQFFRSLKGEFRIGVEGGGMLYLQSFMQKPFKGRYCYLDAFLQNALRHQYGDSDEIYRNLEEALSVHRKELHQFTIRLVAEKRDRRYGHRRFECYKVKEKNGRIKSLGGEIYKNKTSTERKHWLYVELDFLSQEELDESEKGW